jgi:predicted nucleotidyltransferase
VNGPDLRASGLPDARRPEVEEVLRRLTGDVERHLGESLIGLYLYGSLLTGDFDADRSDVDVLALLSEDVSEQTTERLREMHANLVRDHPAWNDRIEVDYVSVEALTSFRTRPRLMARVSPGEPLHLVEANRHYVLNWYLARSGHALTGPPAPQVIPDITRQDFLDVVVAHARSWKDWVTAMQGPGAQAYAVLTLCRARYSALHETQVSKKQAALATAPALPRWSDLIDWALRTRYGPADQETDHDRHPEVTQFVREMSDEVLRVAQARATPTGEDGLPD